MPIKFVLLGKLKKYEDKRKIVFVLVRCFSTLSCCKINRKGGFLKRKSTEFFRLSNVRIAKKKTGVLFEMFSKFIYSDG